MKPLISVLGAFFSIVLTITGAQADRIPTTPTAPDSAVWGETDPLLFDVYGTSSAKDYGNATNYAEASHTKGRWQGLGTSNGIDNGVLWSVGGSAFSNHENLILGQDVTFKFLFWQSNYGNHPYDQIFAAFDFGQDNSFDSLEDTILYERIITNKTINDDKDRKNSRYLEFELTFTVPETMTIGKTWLRSRVHCAHTATIGPNGYLSQGETEDYMLNITANEVPEPTTMLLFGTGLLGFAGLRRRQSKKN